MNLKRKVRQMIQQFGFDVVRHGGHHANQPIGNDPFADMRRFLPGISSPTIFDVGANVGQSIDRFRAAFPDPVIHSFEPSPSTFAVLSSNCGDKFNNNLWNSGVGSKDGKMIFHENESPVMSSLLEPGKDCWGRIVRQTEIEVVTLDAFVRHHAIDRIHVLKSDTQGYDLEVFKGADQLLSSGRVSMVYFEFIFSNMYLELPQFDEVFRYLRERHFRLVSFYERYHQEELLGWSDFLFINKEWHQKCVE